MKYIWQLLKNWRFDILIIFLCLFTLAYMVKYYDVQTFDIKVHNFLLIDYLNEGAFPFPPGYFLLIYLLDFIISYKYPFVLSSLIVLTFFYWWKYNITYTWLLENVKFEPKYVFLITLSILFLSPIFIPAIDGPYWYFGKFTPTIWHNSTLITVFPFCILLVKKTLDWVEYKRNDSLIQLLGLGILIMLIKPSFMFCYIPALPIFAFSQTRKLSKELMFALGLSLVLFCLLVLEKFWIFDLDPMIDKLYTVEEQSKVVFRPLHVHLYFSKEPIFDFLSSFPTTFIFFILWGKKAFSSKFVTFSFILLVFAIAVYLLLSESGFREFHGNFYWQIPIALFLHYLSLLIFVFQGYLVNGRILTSKIIIFSTFYLVQVSFGLIYFLRLFTGYALS